MSKFKVGDKVVRLDGACHSDGSAVTTISNVEDHQWIRLNTGASLVPNGKLADARKYRVVNTGARHIHADLIEAWANGCEIEYFRDVAGWQSYLNMEAPSWYKHTLYRIAFPDRTPQEIKEDAIKVKVAALQEELAERP